MPHARQLRDADGAYYVGYWRDRHGRRHRTAEYYSLRDALDEAREQQQADAAGPADGQR